jgi:galactonate dehydratase
MPWGGDAIGNGVATEAVQLGLGIEPFHPFFYEDPVMPDNFDEMAYVADKINTPIATGERDTSLWEFEMALSRNAMQYVRRDVCLVGGIAGAKKIAALAAGAQQKVPRPG